MKSKVYDKLLAYPSDDTRIKTLFTNIRETTNMLIYLFKTNVILIILISITTLITSFLIVYSLPYYYELEYEIAQAQRCYNLSKPHDPEYTPKFHIWQQ